MTAAATPLDLYHRFVAAQPAELRGEVVRRPVVVVLGERARGGQSALVEAGVAWRDNMRKMRPSLYDDDAGARFYHGDDLIAVELAIAMVDDETPAARDGLAGLFAALADRDCAAVVVVEYDTLDPGAADVLVARAERIRAKLDLLAASIRASVEARLCVVASAGGDGFDDFVRVLAAAKRTVRIDVASGTPSPAAITAAFATALPYGLTTLPSDQFAQLVDFLADSDGFASALAAFLAAFASPTSPAHTARLTDLSFFVSDGTLVGAPFPVLDRSKTRPAPALPWRHVVPGCALAALVGVFPFAASAIASKLPWHPAPPITDAGTAPTDAAPVVPDGGQVVMDAMTGTDAGIADAAEEPGADASIAPPDAAVSTCPPVNPAVALDLAVVKGRMGENHTRAIGIDISSYDAAPMPWASLKQAGVTFAYIKASEGLGTDSKFAAHWRDAKACGILRGAYHLVRFNDDSGAQAAVFYGKISADPGELPPSIDVETSAVIDGGHLPGESCTLLKESLDTLTERITKFTGRTTAIYTSKDAWGSLGTCADKLGDRPLWLKHYDVESKIKAFGDWKSWTFWQATGSAALTGERKDGKVHQIDVDVFTGTDEDLRRTVPVQR